MDPPEPDEPGETPEGSFRSSIKAHHSNLCIDVPGWRIQDDVQLIQWDCHLRDNQIFDFEPVDGLENVYTISSIVSGKCLDVEAKGHDNGVPVRQATCTGAKNQQFELRAKPSGYYQIAARHSQKCINVAEANPDNGAKLEQWYCYWAETDIANQVFYIDVP